MSKFLYRAWDAAHAVEEGELEANSVVQAVQLLESRGLRVESICQVDLVDLHLQSLPLDQQAAIMHRRAESLANARRWSAPIRALAQEVSPRPSTKSIQQIATKLNQAASIEQLASDPQTAELLPLVLRAVDNDQSAAEIAGSLVNRLVGRRKWSLAWLYPTGCFLFCLVLLMLGSNWIVSTFEEMFAEFDLTLPRVTLLLLAINRLLFANAWGTIALVVGAAIVGLLLYHLDRKYSWRLRWAPRLASGSSSAIKAMGQIAQNVAELVDLNYPTGLALRIAGRGCRHPYYRDAIARLADQSESVADQSPQTANRNLPPLFVWLLSRDASPDASAIRRLADVYLNRQQYNSERLALALSQTILVLTGLLIAFTMIALFMPLVRMITSLA